MSTINAWPQIETTSSWGEGRVMHARAGKAAHRFDYPIAFMRVPLSQLDNTLSPQRRWGGLFGVNCAGVFSFHNRDHGACDGSELLPWLRDLLQQQGLNFALGEVVLQAFPRVLGYVFNPVSFWFCHDQEGRLRTVLCEVNNTFGERHNYLVFHADLRPIEPGDCLDAKKVFHVSPFFPVEGNYVFRFLAQPGIVGANIEYRQGGQVTLRAHVGGRLQPLSARCLLSALLRFSWLTLMVFVRIHWQAIHLWRKGAIFHCKPSPPVERTT